MKTLSWVFEYGKPHRGDKLIEMNVDKLKESPVGAAL
jgi:hypothetical protein